ncbi:alpha/beta hydrolase [soil metagenome]
MTITNSTKDSRPSPDPNPLVVQSADGTPIAVWVAGDGPPVVVVHGAMSDHTANFALIDAINDSMTTYSPDRRGRGASGDCPDYAIQREFEDVAAVVDELAARSGGPMAVWGHSYGADCALGGAALTDNIDKLLLYEPGLGIPIPPESIGEVEKMIATGDLETAMQVALIEIVEMTPEEVALLRSSPTWAARLETLPILPRELRAESSWNYTPGEFEGIKAPTLIMAGSESPEAQNEATSRALAELPNARLHVLQGHAHIAHRTDPAMVAEVIQGFVRSSRGDAR